jgi:hypothetical protein
MPENNDDPLLEPNQIVLAQFDRPEQAAAALEELMRAGFLNVEQEVEGERTDLIVDPGGRRSEVEEILALHAGVEINLRG